MSENVHKSHNVSKLMYHFVCPTVERRALSGTDDVRFAGGPVSLTTLSGRSDNCIAV